MRVYTPPHTINEFLHVYRDKRVGLVLGPIGSGKTIGMLMTLLDWAFLQQPNAKGERKTRFAVVRNTRPQLRDSVIRSVRDWIDFNDPRVEWRDTEMTLAMKFGLPDDTTVHTELMFRALDDERDAAKLLSVEYTGFWLSEFREIPLSLLTDVRSRAGRYPSRAEVPATHYGVIGESNFPVMGSEWHDLIEVRAPDWLQVLKQPSAVSSQAENRENLPPTYYEELMVDSTESWQKAHILCEYPEANDGQAVFGQTFSREKHVAKASLRPISGIINGPPIIVGMDQGRSPAALFGQLDGRGRLNIYSELHTTNVGMRKFMADFVMPHLNEKYFNTPVIAIVDPASSHKTEVDDESPLDVIRAAGLHAVPAPTNVISRRLEAVDRLLTSPDGIIIDPACVELLAALAYRYRYKRKRDGKMEDDTPEKLHPWSDLCFVAGTPIATPDGYVPIESLQPGDLVLTPRGADRVTCTGSRPVDETVVLHLSDGTVLRCTPDHPFAIWSKGSPCFLRADALPLGSPLVAIGEYSWASGKTLIQASGWSPAHASPAALDSPHRSGKSIRERASTALARATGLALAAMGSRLMNCGSVSVVATSITGTSGPIKPQCLSTNTSGNGRMGLSLMGIRSTTSTTIPPTMTSTTSKLFSGLSMHGFTCWRASLMGHLMSTLRWLSHVKPPRHGTVLPRDAHGTRSMRAKSSLTVVRRDYLSDAVPVFNLTTERDHVYYAGPALVHNCDSLQYMALSCGGIRYGRVVSRMRVGTSAQSKPAPSVRGWT